MPCGSPPCLIFILIHYDIKAAQRRSIAILIHYIIRPLCILYRHTVKILILGGGQVGSAIAEELAAMSGNDITIVDTDETALKNLSARLDVQTLAGNGASPAILEQAGAADTDMLLALTRSDETNLVACKLAAALFNIPQRIARVRLAAYQEYGDTPDDAPDALSGSLKAFDVTDSIHPEHLVTEHIAGLLS